MSGALERSQLEKLPDLIKGRRANGALVQECLGNHPRFMIQEEIGQSSWFGFSLVLRDPSAAPRADLVRDLKQIGFECRPIVTGNFAKNEVMKYFDYEIHSTLKNANYIDEHGLFVGNHHYPIPQAIDALAAL
jgi:CDP-6-deoxy-D-xylo-4-hexulose-3-dehydrase